MGELSLLVAGGFIGFIASIAKDFFIEKQKKNHLDKNFKREKLEELYILVTRVFNESLHPVELRNGLSGNDDGAKGALICRFYLPSILKSYQKFINESIIFNTKALTDFQSISTEEIEKLTKEYQSFLNILEVESKKYS